LAAAWDRAGGTAAGCTSGCLGAILSPGWLFSSMKKNKSKVTEAE